jgi:hypothetical protein
MQQLRPADTREAINLLHTGIRYKTVGIPELIYHKSLIEQGAYGNIKDPAAGVIRALLKMVDADINRQEQEMAAREHDDDLYRRLDVIESAITEIKQFLKRR